MKHSPEPWSLVGTHGIKSSEGRTLGGFRIYKGKNPAAVSRANVDRVIACVNGCAGINPEAVPAVIEKAWHVYVGLLQSPAAWAAMDERLRSDLDGLHAAIERARPLAAAREEAA